MASILYPYQLEAVEALHRSHSEYQRILLALPTGSGKTLVAATYAKKHFLDRGLGVLWLAHSEELLDQAYRCFVLQQGVDPSTVLSLYAGKERSDTKPNARLCFMNNVCRNGPIAEMHLLVVDEAHRAAANTYMEWMSVYKTYRSSGAKALGLTATPYRIRNGQHESLLSFGFSRPVVPVFQKMAYRKSFCDLAKDGLVAPFRQVRIDSHLSFNISDQNSGDFTSASLESLNTRARNKIIADEWRRNQKKYGKTLIFVGTQAHARSLAQMFGEDGDYAVSDDGMDIRREAIERFRTGSIKVLLNVKILSEGVDVPDIRTIMLARPTMSPNLFMQMVGRGSRIVPGKSFFYIVDIHDQLGKYEGLLVGVQDLADGDDRLLQVIEKKAEAAEKLEGSQLRELAQDSAVLLELAAQPIEAITRSFVGWISFFGTANEPKHIGALLTADEFATMECLADHSERILPHKVSALDDVQRSDALQKCRDALAEGLWGRLGRFSNVLQSDLELLQTTARDVLSVSSERAGSMSVFAQALQVAASRWGIPQELIGQCCEEIAREPNRAAVIIRVESGGVPTLLTLGVLGAAELRKSLELKREGRFDGQALMDLQTVLESVEPKHAAYIRAITKKIWDNVPLDDYCVVCPDQQADRSTSSRIA